MALWPAWEVDLIETYLDRQPPPEQSASELLAQLCAMYGNVHRAENVPPHKAADFLPPADAFAPVLSPPPSQQYSDVDKSFLAAFGMKIA